MLEGLPPNDATHVMQLFAPKDAAGRIADLISETFDPAEVAVANFEVDAETWRVEVFAGEAFDEALLRDLVSHAAGPELAAAATFEDIAPKDWVSSSLEGLEPVRVGRFVVHGSHDRAKVAVNTIGIEIEAALAFGTGHHGTTQGCLAAIADAEKGRKPLTILDIGTGTGVLAIAAARVFRRPVVASDIDPVAVKTARANARSNGAGPLLVPVLAAGAGAQTLRKGGPYDLILANILLPPLKKLARPLAGLLAPGGRIVLSGLLEMQANAALAAYRAQGLTLERRRNIEGWSTLTLKRDRGV